MRRTFWTLLSSLILAAMLLSACGGAATQAPAETQAPAATEAPADQPPIKIGASLPMTGAFAINGELHKKGYELCVNLINEKGGVLGRQLELIASDNQSDTETAIAQTERFISQDKVDLIYGTFSSRLTFPMTPITEQAKLVHPIPSGAALRIYERGQKYIFYFQPNAAEYVGNSPVEMIQNLIPEADRPKTVALVHADDFFANSIVIGLTGGKVEIEGSDRVVDLAPGSLAEAGMELVFQQQWPEEGFSDWISLANSIKASNAEMVFGLTASPDETIQLVRAMQTVDYNPKAVYLSQGTQEEFREGVGDAANGIFIHSSWHPAVQWEGLLAGEKFTNQDFIAAYQAAYNSDPDEDVAIPFAICQGIDQAVRAVGTTDNTAIRDWLAARTAEDPVQTILGNFYWDERGLPVNKPFLMTQWQDGELKFVYPTGEFPGTVDPVWPKPEW